MNKITISYKEDEDGGIIPEKIDYDTPLTIIETVGLLEWAKTKAGLDQL